MSKLYERSFKKYNDINRFAGDVWRMFVLGYASPETIAEALGVKFTDVLCVIRKEFANRGKN